MRTPLSIACLAAACTDAKLGDTATDETVPTNDAAEADSGTEDPTSTYLPEAAGVFVENNVNVGGTYATNQDGAVE